jgi:hypothetical protein
VLPNGECRIDLRFHFEGSDWRAEGRRRVAAMQGCVMGSDPLAGAEALRVALGATPKHWNMRTSTASFIET